VCVFKLYHDKLTLRIKTMAEKNGKPAFDKPKVSVITVVVVVLLLLLLLLNSLCICLGMLYSNNVCPIKP